MPVKPVSSLLFAALAVVLSLLAGCASAPKPPPVQESIKYTVDDTGRVAYADPLSQETVVVTGLQERFLADGRLDLVASVKDKTDQPIKVEVQCLFRDADGFVAAQATLWQPLSLSAQSTETVHFTASSTISKRYSLRFRQAR